MPPDNKRLLEARAWALDKHRGWKQRSRVSDLMIQGRWNVIWDDTTVSEHDPMVENIYIESLEDKVGSAAAITPWVDSPPRRGTQKDRAELSAQKRRRAFVTLMQDSMIGDKQFSWYFDWWQHGAMYGLPWKDWPSDSQYPYAVRMDPRFAYPLTHNSNDELTSIFFLKYRRVADLEAEYGRNHPGLIDLRGFASRKQREPEMVEEIWWFDQTHWAVGLVATMDRQVEFFRYVNPETPDPNAVFSEWLVPPHEHMMGGCPVVEKARRSADGEYRSPLDPMIPNLKQAHNLMARLITQVEHNTFPAKVIEGVENIEDYGPGAILIGDGSGNARIQTDSNPMNIEGFQHVAAQLESARNVGAFPQQRSGQFGASIASAKATTSVMGSYNVQQAWAQKDMALFYRVLLQRLAEFDEKWCGGSRKEITGYDEGELYSDSYDPATFWKGDYRVEVGFHNVGLDEQQHLIRLSMSRNMGGLARRSFMRKSGLVPNPLAEEREMALEQVADAFQAFIYQQANAGNLDPLMRYTAAIDKDDTTPRAAALKVIQEMLAVPTEGPAAAGAAGGGNPVEAILQNRSLEQGGIPGNAAAGPPAIGPSLAGLLPSGQGQAAAELLPGGSGP